MGDFSACKPSNFQFLKRTGHQFRVPETAPGFIFTMDGLKANAGQGDRYVRLPKVFDSTADALMNDSDLEHLPSNK